MASPCSCSRHGPVIVASRCHVLRSPQGRPAATLSQRAAPGRGLLLRARGTGHQSGKVSDRRRSSPLLQKSVVDRDKPQLVETTRSLSEKPLQHLLGKGGTVLLGAGGILASTGFSLETPSSVVEALGILAAIIFVHECGHFAAARLQRIHVTKFAVGFGPRLFTYKGPEVEYSLGAIPLGGFVAFPDDDPESPFPKDDPDLLRNRPVVQRLLVAVAGVAANFAFAFGVLSVQFGTVGQAVPTYLPGVRVTELLPASAARDAGMLSGDVIVAVNGLAVPANRESVPTIVSQIRDAGDSILRFEVRRGKKLVKVPVRPTLLPSGSGVLGVRLEALANVKNQILTPLAAMGAAASDTLRLTQVVSGGLLKLVSNLDEAAESLSGPVAVVARGAEVARGDAAGIFQFAAVVNINLAVVNLVPLPALDGGFIALLALEALRGKKLPTEVEQAIQGSGFLLLTGTGLFLLFRDTLRLDFVQDLLQ